MILGSKTLEKLRKLINEETGYRSGPELVKFFNKLGFDDYYGQGFPSRWIYTDEKLSKINGTPELDKCIKVLFSPQNFIGRINELDNFIKDFNQYLAFDKWKVIRNGIEITFTKLDRVELDENKPAITEDEFMKREFQDISLECIGLDVPVLEVLQFRIEEIQKCLTADAPLSVIFLAGSSLEGVLLGVALKYPREFNQSKSAPRDETGKVKQYQNWTLSDFINVTYEVGLLAEDVKKYSHSLRDFRNYIHPFQQVSSGFNPDKHTAKISWQVLKAALYQLSKNKIKRSI